jgi:hypothetical protein
LKVTEEAITHTPTALDLYVLKARLYKHAGDAQTAYYFMDLARRLDTQDRYLNVKTVRYALRADKEAEAETTVKLFLRDSDSLHSLFDLQVQWYELCVSDYYLRNKLYHKALKKYSQIEKHFEDFYEDQFDFHTYCLRKMTLRAYVEMLSWEATVRNHRFFYKAANNAINIYLRLYDSPLNQAKISADQQADTNLSEEEKKTLQKSAKKAAQKEKKLAEQRAAEDETKRKEAAAKSKKKNANSDEPVVEDKDPDGVELVKLEPLQESTRWLKELLFYSPHILQTHIQAANIYLRKNKPLLVLRALLQAKKIDAQSIYNDPEIHHLTAQFLHYWNNNKETLNSHVKAVIENDSKGLIDLSQSAQQYNENFIKHHANSLSHRLSGRITSPFYLLFDSVMKPN